MGQTTRYVSSSIGSDAYPGTPTSPLKSITDACNKGAKTVILKRGDTWTERLQNINIDAYDTGVNPIIKISNNGIRITNDNISIKNITIKGVDVDRNNVYPGIFINANNISLDNVGVSDFVYDVEIHASGTTYIKNIVLSNMRIYNAWSNLDKAMGIYVANAQVKLVNSQIINCGWKNGTYTESTIYAHPLYEDEYSLPMDIENCLIKHGGNIGLQVRGGGIIKNTRIEDCPVGIVLGESITHDLNEIGNCTILGSSSAANHAGQGILTRRCQKLWIHDNYIGNKILATGHGGAVIVTNDTHPFIPNDVRSQNRANLLLTNSQNITIERNIIHNWRASINVSVQVINGTIKLYDNKIYQQGKTISDLGYTNTPLAGSFTGGILDYRTNLIATEQFPNSVINGIGKDIPVRTPYSPLLAP